MQPGTTELPRIEIRRADGRRQRIIRVVVTASPVVRTPATGTPVLA